MSTLYLMTRTPGGGYVKEVRTVRTLPVCGQGGVGSQGERCVVGCSVLATTYLLDYCLNNSA